MKVSYVDDKNALALSKVNKDNTVLHELIDSIDWTLRSSNQKDSTFSGIRMYEIKALSSLYGFDVFGVSFSFEEVEPTDTRMLSPLEKMLHSLFKRMSLKQGYYIIRVPQGFPILTNAINNVLKGAKYADSTICYLNRIDSSQSNYCNTAIELLDNNETEITDTLVRITYDSFADYPSQYYSSEILRPLSGMVYRNWITECLRSEQYITLYAVVYGKPVGFITVRNTEYALEIVLNAVEKGFRGSGIYTDLCMEAMKHSTRNKLITVSTQHSNFSVQRIWTKLGFEPFYSFSLLHLNTMPLRGFANNNGKR